MHARLFGHVDGVDKRLDGLRAVRGGVGEVDAAADLDGDGFRVGAVRGAHFYVVPDAVDEARGGEEDAYDGYCADDGVLAEDVAYAAREGEVAGLLLVVVEGWVVVVER